MADTCKTVVIATANGPVEINESDFDPKVHKLQGDDTAKPKGRKK